MRFGSVTRRVDLAGADCLADASEEGGGVVVATGDECCEFICECCEFICECCEFICECCEFICESNEFVNESINESINSFNESINESINHSSQSVNHLTPFSAPILPLQLQRLLRLRRPRRSLHNHQAGTQPRPFLLQVRQPPAALQLLPLGRRERDQPWQLLALSHPPRSRQLQGQQRVRAGRHLLLPLREEGTHGEGLSRSRLRKERAVANTAQAGGEAAKGNNEATTV